MLSDSMDAPGMELRIVAKPLQDLISHHRVEERRNVPLQREIHINSSQSLYRWSSVE